jgi:hypothetical protein
MNETNALARYISDHLGSEARRISLLPLELRARTVDGFLVKVSSTPNRLKISLTHRACRRKFDCHMGPLNVLSLLGLIGHGPALFAVTLCRVYRLSCNAVQHSALYDKLNVLVRIAACQLEEP